MRGHLQKPQQTQRLQIQEVITQQLLHIIYGEVLLVTDHPLHIQEILTQELLRVTLDLQ